MITIGIPRARDDRKRNPLIPIRELTALDDLLTEPGATDHRRPAAGFTQRSSVVNGRSSSYFDTHTVLLNFLPWVTVRYRTSAPPVSRYAVAASPTECHAPAPLSKRASCTTEPSAQHRYLTSTCYATPLPHNPLVFRMPAKCPFCGSVGTVSPETTIKGKSVSLKWCCRKCSHDWPITAGEHIARRSGQHHRSDSRTDQSRKARKRSSAKL